MERELKIGQHVVFIDADRQERDALLLCIHGDPKGNHSKRAKIENGKWAVSEDGEYILEDFWYWPCVNLVVVDKNEGAQDQYGRQTVKENITSVVHHSDSTAKGFCWRFADEVIDWSMVHSPIT